MYLHLRGQISCASNVCSKSTGFWIAACEKNFEKKIHKQSVTLRQKTNKKTFEQILTATSSKTKNLITSRCHMTSYTWNVI